MKKERNGSLKRETTKIVKCKNYIDQQKKGLTNKRTKTKNKIHYKGFEEPKDKITDFN